MSLGQVPLWDFWLNGWGPAAAPSTDADWPKLIIECAFATNPLSAPTWTDISTYVDGISTRRGRQNIQSTFDPGVATLRLDNRDGRFDPTYTSGAYYPNVLPNRRLRIRAQYPASGGTIYPIFDGYVESWTPSLQRPGLEYVTVTAVDAFKVLAIYQYAPTGGVPSEATDARVTRILSAVGLATTSVEAGQSILVAVPDLNQAALDALQDAEATEYGALYARRDGVVAFEGRYHRTTAAASTSSQATFGDDSAATELGYEAEQRGYDDSLIVNEAVVTDSQTTPKTYTYGDATSQGKYLKRSQTRSILTATPNEGYDQAAWIVQTLKDPITRFDQLQLEPIFDATHLWAAVLGREISDRVTVKVRPPSGNVFSQDEFVERIEHDIAGPGLQQWVVTLGLSPVRLTSNANNFLLNDTTHGKLDNASAVLAY